MADKPPPIVGRAWYGSEPSAPETLPPEQDRRQEAVDSIAHQLKQSGRYQGDPDKCRAAAESMVYTAESASFEKITLKKGDCVYAFASRPNEAEQSSGQAFGKRDSSPYYMTQGEFERVQKDSLNNDGKLDPKQLRSGHALPPDNKCDQVVVRQVMQDHEVWRSRCGRMASIEYVQNDRGQLVVRETSLPGHGQQVFCITAEDSNNEKNYGPMRECSSAKQIAVEQTAHEKEAVAVPTASVEKDAKEIEQGKERDS